jgi:hypothetical protein
LPRNHYVDEDQPSWAEIADLQQEEALSRLENIKVMAVMLWAADTSFEHAQTEPKKLSEEPAQASWESRSRDIAARMPG